MNKYVHSSLLNHFHLLKSMGFEYHCNLDLFESSTNDLNLPNDLDQLKNITNNCYLCELSKSRKNVVFASGNKNAKLMFIGDMPSNIEDELAVPFEGRSGEILTKMIENVLRINKNDVYITNILKCKPSNKNLLTNEVNTCKAYLLKQIELVKPQIIVTLGSLAYNTLMEEQSDISKVRGQSFTFKNITLIPTYHPSFLLRNPSSKKESYIDMLKIKNVLEMVN